MSPTRRLQTAAVLVVVITTGAGLLSGQLTRRWQATADLQELANGIDRVPTTIGEWSMQSADQFPQEVVDLLQCAGYLHRTYVNGSTGDVVQVALVLGPGGPISVHSPEICYSSRDYSVVEAPEPFTLQSGDRDDQFWGMTLRSLDAQPDLLRVVYAWSAGNGWQAPKQPRFAFGGAPWLYKLQLAGSVPRDQSLKSHDPCRRFLIRFVPELERALIGSAAQ